ncbi:hypothetical protein C7M84_019940 [Penaeus vannamei]|uniref:Uncharacterized protein n=1 Tax=Penaeus vannamei TaxID=6689 RepID=A0A3R7P645_PENVA|nr:hypothetical protein C7M84_019940 [Penaeus vannamei]
MPSSPPLPSSAPTQHPHPRPHHLSLTPPLHHPLSTPLHLLSPPAPPHLSPFSNTPSPPLSPSPPPPPPPPSHFNAHPWKLNLWNRRFTKHTSPLPLSPSPPPSFPLTPPSISPLPPLSSLSLSPSPSPLSLPPHPSPLPSIPLLPPIPPHPPPPKKKAFSKASSISAHRPAPEPSPLASNRENLMPARSGSRPSPFPSLFPRSPLFFEFPLFILLFLVLSFSLVPLLFILLFPRSPFSQFPLSLSCSLGLPFSLVSPLLSCSPSVSPFLRSLSLSAFPRLPFSIRVSLSLSCSSSSPFLRVLYPSLLCLPSFSPFFEFRPILSLSLAPCFLFAESPSYPASSSLLFFEFPVSYPGFLLRALFSSFPSLLILLSSVSPLFPLFILLFSPAPSLLSPLFILLFPRSPLLEFPSHSLFSSFSLFFPFLFPFVIYFLLLLPLSPRSPLFFFFPFFILLFPRSPLFFEFPLSLFLLLPRSPFSSSFPLFILLSSFSFLRVSSYPAPLSPPFFSPLFLSAPSSVSLPCPFLSYFSLFYPFPLFIPSLPSFSLSFFPSFIILLLLGSTLFPSLYPALPSFSLFFEFPLSLSSFSSLVLPFSSSFPLFIFSFLLSPLFLRSSSSFPSFFSLSSWSPRIYSLALPFLSSLSSSSSLSLSCVGSPVYIYYFLLYPFPSSFPFLCFPSSLTLSFSLVSPFSYFLLLYPFPLSLSCSSLVFPSPCLPPPLSYFSLDLPFSSVSPPFIIHPNQPPPPSPPLPPSPPPHPQPPHNPHHPHHHLSHLLPGAVMEARTDGRGQSLKIRAGIPFPPSPTKPLSPSLTPLSPSPTTPLSPSHSTPPSLHLTRGFQSHFPAPPDTKGQEALLRRPSCPYCTLANFTDAGINQISAAGIAACNFAIADNASLLQRRPETRARFAPPAWPQHNTQSRPGTATSRPSRHDPRPRRPPPSPAATTTTTSCHDPFLRPRRPPPSPAATTHDLVDLLHCHDLRPSPTSLTSSFTSCHDPRPTIDLLHYQLPRPTTSPTSSITSCHDLRPRRRPPSPAATTYDPRSC